MTQRRTPCSKGHMPPSARNRIKPSTVYLAVPDHHLLIDNEERRAKLRRERRDQTVQRLDTAQRTRRRRDRDLAAPAAIELCTVKFEVCATRRPAPL